MNRNEFSGLTDQALLDEAKKMKSNSVMNAVLIGFMVGVIIYSIWKNSVGLFTLIPLFFIFKVFNKPSERDNALKKILKERILI
jgi:hypothetical protein